MMRIHVLKTWDLTTIFSSIDSIFLSNALNMVLHRTAAGRVPELRAHAGCGAERSPVLVASHVLD